MTYTVTIAQTTKEREDAFLVRRLVFVEEQGVPLNLELDEHDDTANHFIVYDNEQPIGAGRIRNIGDATGKIERICILEPYRGKKLGQLIMDEIEKFAQNSELERLKLNAQVYAIPFYERLGYAVTSPEFMDADMPHRTMEKSVPNIS